MYIESCKVIFLNGFKISINLVVNIFKIKLKVKLKVKIFKNNFKILIIGNYL